MVFPYLVAAATVVGMCITIYAVFYAGNPPENDEEAESKARPSKSTAGKSTKDSGADKKGSKGKTKIKTSKPKIPASELEKHPWLVTILKGHTDDITGLHWSPNGKYMASCALDRTVMVWIRGHHDMNANERRSIRVNIPFDSASQVHWSPDSKAFMISRVEEKFLEVYKLGKKPDGSVGNIARSHHFPAFHPRTVMGFGIASNGKYIVSGSMAGRIVVCNLKGLVLQELDFGGPILRLKISSCGRYFAVCGERRELSVFEVNFDEERFRDTKIKWILKGHEDTVVDFDLSVDSSKIVTVTSKGFWRLFDTTGNRINVICEGTVGDSDIPSAGHMPSIGMTPDCRVVYVGYASMIHVFIIKLGEPSPLESRWTLPCELPYMFSFSTDGKYMIVGSGKSIRLYKNIPGYHATTIDLKRQLKDSTLSQTLKARLGEELLIAERVVKDLKVE